MKPEEFRARERAYRAANLEKVRAKGRAATKRRYQRDKKKYQGAVVASKRRRRVRDPAYRLGQNVKYRIHRLMKGKNAKRTHEMIGYTSEQLFEAIRSKMVDGMTMENYGHGRGQWHIDHVRPVASFNLDDYASPEAMIREMFSLANLQPMWSHDNLAKSSIWQERRWHKGVPLPV
jgi:hypothetical protein